MSRQRVEQLSSIQADRPRVIAHRGLSSLYPENTLISFDAARKAGPDMIELDFHETADGHLVCVHDHTLRRYLGPDAPADIADRPIEKFTLAQLRELDLGAWKDARFKGTRIATLDEALDTCRDTILLIERKSGSPEQTLDVLKRHGAIDRVIVQSFDLEYVKVVHDLAPQVTVAALGGGALNGSAGVNRLRATGASAIHWSDSLTKSDVDQLHAEGWGIWIYTLNSELSWRGAAAMGIDGITTDRCDVARELFPRSAT